jgi:hypothetical protein
LFCNEAQSINPTNRLAAKYKYTTGTYYDIYNNKVYGRKKGKKKKKKRKTRHVAVCLFVCLFVSIDANDY